ncbi:hypothetical protein [Arthrobacter sp. ZGTC212]|uniref:hypothetical protein n=1 Tax=Arthrobacter sp. ZGTC212 TaxID=2058899 RepID=UPI000CE407CE|nr:hypothetical protein [Arthrobacter sp. ZGTC212]
MIRFAASNLGWGPRLVGVSALGAVAAAVSIAGAPSALAANDYLEFSLDGATYSPSIAGPIFNESLQYVPGASTDAVIWIRNNSDEPAWLSSAAIMVRSDPQLNNQLGLTAVLKPDFSLRSALGEQGSCTDVSEVWAMEPGQVLELGLVFDLSSNAANDTMNRSAAFDVVFLLESKDAAPRQACTALVGSDQRPAGSTTTPGNPDPTAAGESSSELRALSGTAGSRPATGPSSIYPATLPGRSAYAGPPHAIGSGEPAPQTGIIPAGFQSTVEPIIRSLSGTLLIAMSVLFSAAVVFRLRNRSANE